MTGSRKALIFGATGVAGRALTHELEQLESWNVIGVARKPPYFSTTARFVAADLMNAESCNADLARLYDVTHVFYAAYLDDRDIANTRAPNSKMFANSLEAIKDLPALEHVCLLQGTKYYGQYLGPFKTPAKESDPRVSTPHFYYDQQDLLCGTQAGRRWTWSCARPHVICGFALGNPLNLISMLGVYAALMREAGRPLTFPGKPGAFSSIYQATDAGLLARAMVWMSTTSACANEAFNITNGDFFRYQNLWPIFAKYFAMELGDVETIDLRHDMPSKVALWERIVRKYGLEEHPLERLVNWDFANYAFSNDWDVMSDTTKCRKYGFIEFIDSEEMFLTHFEELRRSRIIP